MCASTSSWCYGTKTVKIVVEGVLRGTGFKAHVYLLARRLGLRGHLKDVEEGKELICIEGGEEQINEFLENLSRGPPFALINSVTVSDGAGESCGSPMFDVDYREF
ncbi:MAG: acylphosphatase [Ignisphaera sp.]|nr:acylphosphatase [Ignisphaera sp.]MCX8168402.1 acylphosphatase [Ignisphaera sp.]MDW8086101.1 acylphosphatase [Ignisphaera sp.]